MAVPPVPRRPITATGLAGVRMAGGGAGSADIIGRSVERFGNTIEASAGHFAQNEIDFEFAAERARLATGSSDLNARAKNALQEKRLALSDLQDPHEIEQQWAQDVEDVQRDLTNTIADDDQGLRGIFAHDFSRLADAEAIDVQKLRRAREIDHGLANLAATQESLLQAASRATSEAERLDIGDQYVAALDKAYNSGLITAQGSTAMRQGFLEASDDVRATQLISDNPYAAAKALNEFEHLDPKRRVQLEDAAKREIKAREAIAKAEARAARAGLRDESRYAVAVLNAGQSYAGLDSLIKRADGVDPELATSLRLARDDQTWASSLSKLPPQDQVEELTSLQAGIQNEQDPVLAETYTNRLQRGIDIVEQTQKGLSQDRLGWAEQRGVVPQTQLDPSDPDTFQARSNAMAAGQEYYGIDFSEPFRPEELEQITKAFGTAEDPRDKLGVLQGFVYPFGDEATQRKAVTQLIEKGGLPRHVAQVLDIGKDPMRRPASSRLISELLSDEKAVVGDPLEVKDNAAEATTEYVENGIGAAYLRMAEVTGDQRYADRARSDLAAIQKLAKMRTGLADDPVESSIGDWSGHLAAVDDEDIAHAVFDRQYDPAKMRSGFVALRQKVADEMAAPGADDVTGDLARRQIDTAVIQATRQGGLWVNDGDDFVLIVPGTGRAAVDAEGKIVRYSPADVLRASRSPSGAANDMDGLYWTPGR